MKNSPESNLRTVCFDLATMESVGKFEMVLVSKTS